MPDRNSQPANRPVQQPLPVRNSQPSDGPPQTAPPPSQGRSPQRSPYQRNRPPAVGGIPATHQSQPAATFDRSLVPAKTYTDINELGARLEQLQQRAHVLCPTLQISAIPEFHEVYLCVVMVDPDPRNGMVYEQEGDLALTKFTLDKFALNCNVRWNAAGCYRYDDRSDPHYCAFRCEGWVQLLDGHWQNITGHKEVDLREGNPTIFDPGHVHEGPTCSRACGGRIEPGFRRGWSTRRLNGAREHILALCESKAKNRAIRTLGVKSKYTRAELQRPFVMPKLRVTGRSDDPELELEARRELMRIAIQSSHQLFPGHTMMAPQIAGPPPAAEVPAIELQPPPPLPTEPKPDEDDEVPPVEDCGCPDAPAGVHMEGCKLFPDLEPGSEG